MSIILMAAELNSLLPGGQDADAYYELIIALK